MRIIEKGTVSSKTHGLADLPLFEAGFQPPNNRCSEQQQTPTCII